VSDHPAQELVASFNALGGSQLNRVGSLPALLVFLLGTVISFLSCTGWWPETKACLTVPCAQPEPWFALCRCHTDVVLTAPLQCVPADFSEFL